MITCDTHALIFWALAPERLSVTAATAIGQHRVTRDLACSNIVLWEIAMLAAKGRIILSVEPVHFIQDVIAALRLIVLPITAEIAVRAQILPLPQGDPADRLIAATALHHQVPLVTLDKQLGKLVGLSTVW